MGGGTPPPTAEYLPQPRQMRLDEPHYASQRRGPGCAGQQAKEQHVGQVVHSTVAPAGIEYLLKFTLNTDIAPSALHMQRVRGCFTPSVLNSLTESEATFEYQTQMHGSTLKGHWFSDQ